MKIWKFPLEVTDTQDVQIPADSTIICVQSQRDDLTLWAIVDPACPARPRKIAIHGTGHEVMPHGKYLGTAQTHGGKLVWHVFDMGWND